MSPFNTPPAKPVNEVVVRLQCHVLCEFLPGTVDNIHLFPPNHQKPPQNPQTKSLSVHSVVFFVYDFFVNRKKKNAFTNPKKPQTLYTKPANEVVVRSRCRVLCIKCQKAPNTPYNSRNRSRCPLTVSCSL